MTSWRPRRPVVLATGDPSRWVGALLVLSVAMVGCASSKPSPAAQAQQQDFLNAVHSAAPDVGAYRSDTELIRLGHAVCDDLRSGAGYQAVADRLGTTAGANRLPSADLGAVITSAAAVNCPQYAAQVK